MKNITLKFLLIFNLFLYQSCNETKIIEQDSNEIVGIWSAFESVSITENDTNETKLVADFFITEDSILLFQYPYYCDEIGYNYKINGDTLKSSFWGNLRINFSITNDTLILKKYITNSYGDSVFITDKYTRGEYDNKTLENLLSTGYNEKILCETNWCFWEKGTKKYDWTEYDTLVYNPIRKITIERNDNYKYLSKSNFTYQNDTFKVLGLSKEFLTLEKNNNGNIIKLSYMDSTTLEFNK